MELLQVAVRKAVFRTIHVHKQYQLNEARERQVPLQPDEQHLIHVR